jgi:hypothetical protein
MDSFHRLIGRCFPRITIVVDNDGSAVPTGRPAGEPPRFFAPAPTTTTLPVQPPLCIGRHEGADRFLGRGEPAGQVSARAIAMASEPQYVFGAAYFICTCRRNEVRPRAQMLTLPT